VSKPRPGDREVHRITTVQAPLADDVARRTRRYLAQMGIRLVCFVGAVLTWGLVPVWLSWVLLVGAIVLPYVAVILANAGRERSSAPEPLFEPRSLGAGRPAAAKDYDGPRDGGQRDAGSGRDGDRADTVRGEWGP